ncbi:MAG TPA: hypothetical protein PKK26_03930 [Candidatus Wallbacteria bacterium]|nr:hypothetical protein [Candidatus Wallbacteria bacterium]
MLTYKSCLSHEKKAFTVVEVLMATAVLSMLIYSLYTLFSRTVSSVDVGSWKSQTQTKMRNALKQLTKDVSAATYRSLMSANKTEINNGDDYKLKHKTGAVDTKTTQTDLLKFKICTPGRTGLREADIQPKVVVAELKCTKTAEGKTKLVYKKSVDTAAGRDSDATKGDNVAEDKKEVTLIEDITKFETKIIDSPDNPNISNNTEKLKTLKIEIECAHPNYPKTTMTEYVEIPLHVSALSNL